MGRARPANAGSPSTPARTGNVRTADYLASLPVLRPPDPSQPIPNPFLSLSCRGGANPIQTKELLSRANLAYWRGDKVGASICMWVLLYTNTGGRPELTEAHN